MSMSLTLRRFEPSSMEGLSNEVAVAFSLNLPNEQAPKANETIEFFEFWHIVHYLSSGTNSFIDFPSGFLLGGNEWIEIDPSMEPVRKLSQHQVGMAAAHITGLSDLLIDQRLSALCKEDSEIYCSPLTKETIPLAREALKEIRQFFERASDNGNEISLAMS